MGTLFWIALGAGGLFLLAGAGSASIAVSADCSTITVRGGEEALRKLLSDKSGPAMQGLADALAETGVLPTGMETFNAMFAPFAPAGCSSFPPNTQVDLGGGNVVTLGEIASMWDEMTGGVQDQINAAAEAAEMSESGEWDPEINLPEFPEFPLLPGVNDDEVPEPPSMGPVDPGEPPSMGGRTPRLDAAGTLFMARKARMGGGGYYVKRGVKTPRSKVKALVGARVVRAPRDTSAMLQGARRKR